MSFASYESTFVRKRYFLLCMLTPLQLWISVNTMYAHCHEWGADKREKMYNLCPENVFMFIMYVCTYVCILCYFTQHVAVMGSALLSDFCSNSSSTQQLVINICNKTKSNRQKSTQKCNHNFKKLEYSS